MPQFDASGIVEGLECKLKPYADFEDVIPEPSDRQIGDFLAGLKKVYADAKQAGMPDAVDTSDPDQVAEAIEALDPDQYVRFQDSMAGLHAALCSERPSKAQILAVPLRRRNLFFQWLQQEVMSPEAAPPAGSGQVSTLPRAAAG